MNFTEMTELQKWELGGREKEKKRKKEKKKKYCKSCDTIFSTFTGCIPKTEELEWEEPCCYLITS